MAQKSTDPTLEEIAERAAEIRKEWQVTEHIRRDIHRNVPGILSRMQLDKDDFPSRDAGVHLED